MGRLPTAAAGVERRRVRIGPTRGFLEVNLRELWEHRELLYFFVWRDVKVRYKQTVVGVMWAIIQPLLTMVIFTVFFGMFAKLPSGDLPYPIFYYSALLPWMYFAGALQHATNAVVEHQAMITKVYFPRLILPLAAVVSGLVDFALAFFILIGMVVFYGIAPSPAVLFLPLFLLFAIMTALGAGLWLSALNAIYRDVRYVVPFVIQCWMFVSPVVYPSAVVPEAWGWLYGLNPMTGVIEGFRWALLGQGHVPAQLGVSVVAIAGILVGGLLYFSRIEGTIGDRV